MRLNTNIKISYDKIIANWSTSKDPKFWSLLEEIHRNIPNRKIPVDYIDRCLSFTNTYIVEKSIIDSLPNYEFYDDSHDNYHGGIGADIPDFKINGKHLYTAELKMVKNLSRAYAIPNEAWHKADIYLVFDISTNRLFKLRRDKSLISIIDFHLNRPLLTREECSLF